MRSQWRQTTWGDEISLEYGKAIRGYQDATGPFRVFGSNGPIGWADKALAEGPGVILGRKGAYRGVHFSREPFFVIDTAYYVKPKTDLNMRWLYYAIIYHKLGEIDDGSPIPSTTRAAVYVMDVDVPSMSEQDEIAEILGALDDKIELNRKTAATLEEMARALYRSWFVDFDPVHAKAAGRAPAHMAPQTAALFPDSFGEDGLPEGWKYAPLHELALVTMGLSPKGSTYNDQGIGTPLCNGPVEYGDYFLKQIKWTTDPTRLAQRGDLIVCVRGSTTGRHAFADAEYCLGRGVAGVHGLDGAQEFVEASVLTNMDRLLEKTTGSVFPSLAKNDIKDFEVVKPVKDLIHEYCGATRSMREQVWLKVEENQTLANLRDTLLPRLMSGALRVGEAKEQVEELAV